MKLNQAGRELIQEFEGYRSRAYQDSAGVWTIGWGHTATAKPGMTISKAEAEQLFTRDVQRFENCVNEAVSTHITQNQYNALVSFAYNVGCGALRNSTLLRELNAGDYQAASREFLRWNKITVDGQKKELAGLTRRRKAEQKLFEMPSATGGGVLAGSSTAVTVLVVGSLALALWRWWRA